MVTYKTIPGFSNYLAGDNGTIWYLVLRDGGNSVERVQVIPRVSKRGTCRVALVNDSGVCVGQYAHNLILNTFVGPRPEKMECCHFPDKTRTNNQLKNLRWDTSKANASDREFHKKLERFAIKQERERVNRMEKLQYVPSEATVYSRFRLDGKRRRVVIAKQVDPEYGPLIAHVNELRACAEAVVQAHTEDPPCAFDCGCYVCLARRTLNTLGPNPSHQKQSHSCA